MFQDGSASGGGPAGEALARTLEPPREPRARLSVAPYDYAQALRLERELGVSHTLAQVLVRRGLAEPDEARAFLAAGEQYDPGDFAGIDVAVETVMRHLAAGERITIHGDYDCDGVCATAILVRGLRALGGQVDWHLPDRIADGYGLSLATVGRLAERGTSLLITVDCAITAVEEVAAARAAGLDVVVTDHHRPRADGTLPAAPIVHPSLCGYPCPDLCGAGVAHKLLAALVRAAGADQGIAERDLDLVALATVADLVPLRGENRRLVRRGIRALAATATPGLRALMEVSRLDPGRLDARSLGFRLAPRLNAAGRVRTAGSALELLLTADEDRASELAAGLDAANAERRATEISILREAEGLLRARGARHAYVLAGEGWHPGVIGIVASRLAERWHRPVVMIALDGDEGTGSGRSIPGFDLLAGLDACDEHLLRHGGHSAAAGLTIDGGKVEAFRAAFTAHAEAVLTEARLRPERRADAVVAGDPLGLALAEELEALEPCGMGNPAPALLVPAARLADPRTMGQDRRHARATLTSAGARAKLVAFGCDGRLPVAAGEPADVLARLEIDEWNGAVEPRLRLLGAWPCDAARPVRVVGEPADYLAAALAEAAAPPGARAADRERDHAGREVAADRGEGAAGREVAADRGPGADAREVVDRRGPGAAGVLGDLVASGGLVLAVCADVDRRLAGLSERLGGFELCSWRGLAANPAIAERAAHLVALDPPADAPAARLMRSSPCPPGGGFSHLAWGEAELRFSRKIHEMELDLRAPLVAVYRELRAREEAAGEELEALLRGEGPHGRPPALAGRLVRILEELGLVSLDRDRPALAIRPSARTSLDRSQAYRAYSERHRDGLAFLSRATPPST